MLDPGAGDELLICRVDYSCTQHRHRNGTLIFVDTG
jgi:hypothetical protein